MLTGSSRSLTQTAETCRILNSEDFYKYLLNVRSKRKSGQKTFEQLTELTEGFYVKTQVEV